MKADEAGIVITAAAGQPPILCVQTGRRDRGRLRRLRRIP